MTGARLKQINEILRDLEDLKKRGFENMYALDENIKFFGAMRSPVKYIRWFLKERPKIDGARLLELSDFPLGHTRWEEILQRELLEIEQWKFPDNLMRFRKSMIDLLRHLGSTEKRLVLLNLGCGSMELERQIINQYHGNGVTKKIVFIGVDISKTSSSIGVENLKSINIPVEKVNIINQFKMQELNDKYKNKQFYGILFQGDALKIDQYFKRGDIDLIFYTKFRHHLTAEQQMELSKIIMKLCSHILEDDHLNNWFMFMIPLIIRSRWNHPVLLNGAMFSSLRCPSKADLKKLDSGWFVKVTPDGYTKVFDACIK